MNSIVFYLMNEKGLHVLTEFMSKYNSSHIEYVVLSRDKNVENDFYDELSDLCTSRNIKKYERNDKYPRFDGYKFAIGWRWIIEDANKLIVLHDSNLPRYRGFSPLVNMLINGETELGVTALFASDDYDKGDIIAFEKVVIEYPLKIESAIRKIAPLYSKIVNRIVSAIITDKAVKGVPQLESEATYSAWRDANDYFINWNDSAEKIRRIVDSLGFPYLGARTILNRDTIIIDEVEESPDLIIENRDTGKVLYLKGSFPVVICGRGMLVIKKARNPYGESIIPLKIFRSRFGAKV